MLLGFPMAVGALEMLEELEAKIDVARVEAHEVTEEGERALGIVVQTGCGFAERGASNLAAVAAGGGEPAAELFEVGELEAVEELAVVEELREVDQGGRVEGLEAGFRGAGAVEVDFHVREVELDGFAIGDDAGAALLVEEGAELAEAPPEAAAGVVRDVPEEVAQLLAPVLAAGRRQVAEERSSFLGRREVDWVAVTLKAQRPE